MEKELKNKDRLVSSRETEIITLDLSYLFFSFKSFRYFAASLQCHSKAASTPSGFQIKENRGLGQNNLALALRVLEVSAGDTFMLLLSSLFFY